MDLSERTGAATTRHPWESVRSEFFQSRVAAVLHAGRPCRILDIGSGDAWLAGQIAKAFGEATVTCWDINYTDEDLETQGPDGVELVRDEPVGSFDLILMLDVVEHVDDDAAFVRRACTTFLEPGGAVLISVPAYQCLFSEHDRVLGHHRRYRPGQLRAVLPDDVRIVDEGPLFLSLVPPRAIEVAVERITHREREFDGVGAWGGGRRLTAAVERALHVDAWVGLHLGPLGRHVAGLSYWVAGRRVG